jgi:hypothetical protein
MTNVAIPVRAATQCGMGRSVRELGYQSDLAGATLGLLPGAMICSSLELTARTKACHIAHLFYGAVTPHIQSFEL